MRLDTKIIQEQSFTETCLPITIEIAKANIRFVLMHLSTFPKEWTFADKVLAWLSPELHKDITSYYNSDGQPMDKIFEDHQIERLDGSFSRILKSRLGGNS